MKETLKQFFIAPDGRLRAIWRAAIYYAVGTFLIFPLLDRPVASVAKLLHLTLGLTAGYIALAELRNLAVALICTGAFALYERRRIDSYGLPLNSHFDLGSLTIGHSQGYRFIQELLQVAKRHRFSIMPQKQT